MRMFSAHVGTTDIPTEWPRIMASRRSTILAHCADWKPGCVVVLQRHPDCAGGSRHRYQYTLTQQHQKPESLTGPSASGTRALCAAATSIEVERATSAGILKFSQTTKISKALLTTILAWPKTLVGGARVPCQESASGAERSSDLTAESWPRPSRRRNQAANPQKTVLERASEIAVGNNNSAQAGGRSGLPAPAETPPSAVPAGHRAKAHRADRGCGGRNRPVRFPGIDKPAAGGPGTVAQLRVSGNELVRASGQQVVLRGVDRSGTEYECVQGHGIFDGPSDQASVSAMRSRGINAVRVPLNEACWNGESYVKPGLRRRPLPGRHQGLRQAAERQRHGRDRGPALDRRRLHRECLGLLLRRGDLPEADARRGPGGAVLEVGGPHVQGQQRGHLRPVQRAVPRTSQRRQPDRGLAVLAARRPRLRRASATGSPACRPWSTRSARPAPAT